MVLRAALNGTLVLFSLMAVFSLAMLPSTEAVTGGATCLTRASQFCGRNNGTGGPFCGVGMSWGCPSTSRAMGEICCSGRNRGGGWGKYREYTFDIPGPVVKAVVTNEMSDDSVRVYINGIQVYERNPSCRNKPQTPTTPNADITALGALREGTNTMEVWGCRGSGTKYPDAWARICYEYGTGAPSTGEGCINPGMCVPTTCAEQGAQCGSSPDDCGSMLDCGTCPASQTCQNGLCTGPPCDKRQECDPDGKHLTLFNPNEDCNANPISVECDDACDPNINDCAPPRACCATASCDPEFECLDQNTSRIKTSGCEVTTRPCASGCDTATGLCKPPDCQTGELCTTCSGTPCIRYLTGGPSPDNPNNCEVIETSCPFGC